MSDENLFSDADAGLPAGQSGSAETPLDAEVSCKEETAPAPRRRKRRLRWWPAGLVAAVVLSLAAGLAGGFWLARSWFGSVPARTANTPAEGREQKDTPRAKWWTCAMHPQIKLPEPGKCPICFMDLIPLQEDAGGPSGPRQLKLSPAAVALAEIQTTPVSRHYATKVVRMVGKVDYDETRLADITAWVPGRLDRLYVDFTGTPVRKGDHMVYLYSPELIVAQRELLQVWQRHHRPDNPAPDLTAVALRSVEEKLRLLGLLPEQIEEIKRRGTPSDHLTIYAPISGIVIRKHLNEGAYVQTGTKIYTIADLSNVWVYCDAYETDLPWLLYGQQVEFTAESYPGEIFRGRIAFIDPVLDETTRTVKVRLNAPNPDGRLKPGMFVHARVRSRLDADGRVFDPGLIGKWLCPMHPEEIKSSPGKCSQCGMDLEPAEKLGYSVPTHAPEAPLLIPASAPLVTGKRAVVYVRLADSEEPVFEGREVLLGPRAGDEYIVRYGLKEGELVVTKGAFKIDSELQIQAKASMMNPTGGMAGGGHHHGSEHSQHQDRRAGASQPSEPKPLSVPPEFRRRLMPVYQAYLAAGDALAEDDLARARNALRGLPKLIERLEATALDEPTRQAWDGLARQIIFAGWEAVDARDRDEFRKHFAELSQAVARLAADFGHELPATLYRFRCPMASDAQGAEWLQLGREVRNPYFGAALPHCGEQVAEYRSLAPLEVPDQFRRRLGPLYQAYFQAQRALAADQVQPASQALEALARALGGIEAAGLDQRAAGEWQELRGRLEKALDSLPEPSAGKAPAIGELRKVFDKVSSVMLVMVQRFGHAEPTALRSVFCPMAFQNRGARWLQTGQQVANPYFGAKMLRCGTIEREYPPAGAATGGGAGPPNESGSRPASAGPAAHVVAPPPTAERVDSSPAEEPSHVHQP